MKKVILKAPHKEIIRLRSVLTDGNIWSYLVHDRGMTQIPENSLTCMVVEPLEEEKCDELFGHLKLL
jgi:peptidyl-tRNA hydrolase